MVLQTFVFSKETSTGSISFVGCPRSSQRKWCWWQSVKHNRDFRGETADQVHSRACCPPRHSFQSRAWEHHAQVIEAVVVRSVEREVHHRVCSMFSQGRDRALIGANSRTVEAEESRKEAAGLLVAECLNYNIAENPQGSLLCSSIRQLATPTWICVAFN